MSTIHIEHVETLSDTDVDQLAELLVAVAEQGASIGFFPPLDLDVAKDYWKHVPQPNVLLLVARQADRIVGTVNLDCSTKQNGQHRAEVNKLLVHPKAQRLGVGRKLMTALEVTALEHGRTTLYLDTREGDGSNAFYESQGWTKVGVIPRATRNVRGEYESTVFYYKLLDA